MDIDNPIFAAYLAGEATEDEREAVERWRAARSENEKRFRARARIWELYGSFSPEFAMGSAGSATNPIPIEAAKTLQRDVGRRGSGSGRHPRSVPAWAGLAAAALLLLTLGLLSLEGVRGGRVVITEYDEIATVALEDGTVVRLGPNSRLGFNQKDGQRDVVLDGQAYFAVRRNDRIPFRVHMEGGELTVLGTRFDVRTGGPEIRVVVLDGEVEMHAQGQRMSIGASEMVNMEGGTLPVVQPVDNVYGATAWIGEFVAFISTPLSTVAGEFEERFGLSVEIEDSVLAQRTVTGWFRDQSPIEMLTSICFVVNARCVRSADGVRIEYPPVL